MVGERRRDNRFVAATVAFCRLDTLVMLVAGTAYARDRWSRDYSI